MTELFGRRVALQVAKLELTGLDMTFEVQKSLAPKHPNTAEVQVWNLNADHRKQLQELEAVYVDLKAGYEGASALSASATSALEGIGVDGGGMSLIFRGDLGHVTSRRDDVDWITTITSATGERARKKRVSKSFAPGASVASVLQAAADAMGVKLGNAVTQTVLARVQGTTAAQLFNGYALAGVASVELDRLLRACGLEWSIQDDELQVLDAGSPLQELGVLISPETGLVGSPEPGNRGLLRCTCLMLPDLFPGRRVQLQSRHVSGVYRAETTTHRGGTAERDWYVDLELRSEERAA